MKTIYLEDLSIGGGRYGIGASAVDYDPNLPAYLRITDIRDDGTLDLSSKKSVEDPEANNYMLKPGDIVFARTGNSTGRNYFYDERDGAFAYAGFLIKFSLDPKKVNPRYVKYYAQSKPYWDWVASFNTGSTRGNINAKTYGKLPILLPEREKQDAIVLFCDSISDKIRINSQLNDYLLELLKASAKNLYADYERNEDCELPEGWRWVEIDEIAEMVCRGITPKYNPESDETVLGQTCVRNNLVLLENGRLHMPKKVTEKWLQKYDLLINSTGVGSLGRTAQVWFEPSKLVVDSHITIVRCENAKYALYLGFWAFEHEKYIESLHTGSTGQIELPRDHVKAIRFVLPSEEELEKFNAVAAPAVELIVANQQESKRLAELRDTLLPKLMSGEVDVSKVDLTPSAAQVNNHLA